MTFSDKLLAKICIHSYGDAQELLTIFNFDKVHLLESLETGTQGFVCVKGDSVVVVYRGTQKNGKDIKTDMKAWRTNIGNGIKIHAGFYKAYESIETELYNYLFQHRDKYLYLIGHSLGGSLAAITKHHLLESDILRLFFKSIDLVTFGQPRTGNKAFAKTLNNKFGCYRRYVNRADIVPDIPLAIRFRHSGDQAFITDDGIIHDVGYWFRKRHNWRRFFKRFTDHKIDLGYYESI